MTEVLRRAHNLQRPGNPYLAHDNGRALADGEWLHAEAQTEGNGEAGQRVYDGARRGAYFLKYDRLYLFGFAIQAKAREPA